MIKGNLPKIIVCLTLCLFIFVICLLIGFISTTEKPAVETKAEQVEDNKKDTIMAEIKRHIEECYIVQQYNHFIRQNFHIQKFKVICCFYRNFKR